MPETTPEPLIVLTRRAKKQSEQVMHDIQSARKANLNEVRFYNLVPDQELPIVDELKTNIEHDLAIATSLLVDIGFSPAEASTRLPALSQIHFYRTHEHTDNIHGEVPNEGGILRMELADYVSEGNWSRVGQLFDHELGHYSGTKVFDLGSDENSPIRFSALGFDRKKRYVNILGTQYFQPDEMNSYSDGILREPMADLFAYFCAEKKAENIPYHAYRYFRETTFVIALLEKLTQIRQTQFFLEFARLYKSFSDRDFTYFVTLRDDYANSFQQAGDPPEIAMQKATHFVSSLNRIQSYKGSDSVQATDGAVEVRNLGRQLTSVANLGNFNTLFLANYNAVRTTGLVLPDSSTLIKNNL